MVETFNNVTSGRVYFKVASDMNIYEIQDILDTQNDAPNILRMIKQHGHKEFYLLNYCDDEENDPCCWGWVYIYNEPWIINRKHVYLGTFDEMMNVEVDYMDLLELL